MSSGFDLDALMGALDTFSPDAGAYAAAALALNAALTSRASKLDDEVRRRVRERLLDVRRVMLEKHLHPGVLVYLNKLVAPDER